MKTKGSSKNDVTQFTIYDTSSHNCYFFTKAVAVKVSSAALSSPKNCRRPIFLQVKKIAAWMRFPKKLPPCIPKKLPLVDNILMCCLKVLINKYVYKDSRIPVHPVTSLTIFVSMPKSRIPLAPHFAWLHRICTSDTLIEHCSSIVLLKIQPMLISNISVCQSCALL